MRGKSGEWRTGARLITLLLSEKATIARRFDHALLNL
jgi:hypothetical protein